jgi:hypothetical protein
MKKVYLEYIVLSVYCAVFLFIGMGTLYDHSFIQKYPHGFVQRDNFEFLYSVNHIKEEGNYKYVPPYKSEGYTDVIASYPSRLLHIEALYSHVGGIPTWDAMMLVITLTILLPCLAFYLILKEYNSKIALFSLPFTLTFFLFFKTFWFAIQGDWQAFSGAGAFIFFYWTISRIDWKMIIVSAFFLSTIMFDHISDLTFILFFLPLYFLFNFIQTRKIDFKMIGKLTIIIASAFLLSS